MMATTIERKEEVIAKLADIISLAADCDGATSRDRRMLEAIQIIAQQLWCDEQRLVIGLAKKLLYTGDKT